MGKKKDGVQSISVRLSSVQVKTLDKLAKQSGSSRAEIVRRAVYVYLALTTHWQLWANASKRVMRAAMGLALVFRPKSVSHTTVELDSLTYDIDSDRWLMEGRTLREESHGGSGHHR